MNYIPLFSQIHGTHASLVLISGATGGLGKALAVECANRGWDLYLTDLNEANLETLATSLRATYAVKVLYSPCDLTDAAARSALFERFQHQGLHFWALFNVAGTISMSMEKRCIFPNTIANEVPPLRTKSKPPNRRFSTRVRAMIIFSIKFGSVLED